MLAAYLIMLREGIEAALLVGIVASYLKQTGRERWLPAVWLGIICAAVACLVLGLVMNAVSAEFPQKAQELFEAVVGIIAVVLLTSMIFWMQQVARSIKGTLHSQIDRALQSDGRQGWALVVMAFLAVGREGLESVFFLLATFQQDVGWGAPAGALLGLGTSGAIGFAIYFGGVKLDLRRFFRWTGIFIVLVAAGLLAGSVKSLHEAGVWNGLQQTAFDLSEILPGDTVIGTLLGALFGYQEAPSLGAVLAYFAFLIPAAGIFLVQTRPQGAPPRHAARA